MQEWGEAVPCYFSWNRVDLKPTVLLHEAGGLLWSQDQAELDYSVRPIPLTSE